MKYPIGPRYSVAQKDSRIYSQLHIIKLQSNNPSCSFWIHLAISHNMHQRDHTVHHLSSCTTPKKFVSAKVYLKKTSWAIFKYQQKGVMTFHQPPFFCENSTYDSPKNVIAWAWVHITVLRWSCRRWCLKKTCRAPSKWGNFLPPIFEVESCFFLIYWVATI